MHSRPLTACYSHSMSQARGYIEGPDFEESVDGLTLLQSHIDCPDKCLYRLEFINARFLYAVRVDTSHVQVAAKINNCPADSCQVQHGATQSPPSATAGESSGGGGGVMSVDDFDAAVAAAVGLMPSTAYVTDNFEQVISGVLGLFYMLCFLYPVARMTRGIVMEKENKIFKN